MNAAELKAMRERVRRYQRRERRAYERRTSKRRAHRVAAQKRNLELYGINSTAKDAFKKYGPKNIAGMITARAVKNGTLVKADCVKCGDPDSQAHHEDYYKPLDITWLCRSCHKQRHMVIGHFEEVKGEWKWVPYYYLVYSANRNRWFASLKTYEKYLRGELTRAEWKQACDRAWKRILARDRREDATAEAAAACSRPPLCLPAPHEVTE